MHMPPPPANTNTITQVTQEVSTPRLLKTPKGSRNVSPKAPPMLQQDLIGGVGAAAGAPRALRRSISQPVSGAVSSRKVTMFTRKTTVESSSSSTNEADEEDRLGRPFILFRCFLSCSMYTTSLSRYGVHEMGVWGRFFWRKQI